ncbi:hypothetical protein FBU59_004361 [Linderina macrospora]|uniref:Uncharacterized protein n=1 Tax=Linderina macrospora TaxID=4868 RepID=A0ACC1J5R3_9FUNG|nr:hypothetical protein FBU59_004361 [Linderina macrospora]
MSFFIGLSAALLGNVVIGTGQCLQKYALNKLQREWETRRVEHSIDTSVAYDTGYSSSLDIRSRSSSLTGPSYSRGAVTTATPSDDGPRPRYTEKLWIAGLLMNYAGELFGNSVALSYLSASVVAPLGIIAVIVNMVLAERFLGERVTANQRYGFMVIMAGVGCILLVAPRKAAANDAVQFIEVVSTSGILGLFGLFYVVQAVLITMIRKGRQSLFLYVLVASLFGSMNVMVSKILTMFMRLRLSYSAIPNPADIVFYGAVEAAKVRPAILFLTGPQVLAAIVMVASIVGQESFRQQALGRYPVMEFQPVFFATFNVVATLSGLLLFKELDGWMHGLVFFSAFFVGIGFILYGSKFLQKAKSVSLPSHIRLHKENLKSL